MAAIEVIIVGIAEVDIEFLEGVLPGRLLN